MYAHVKCGTKSCFDLKIIQYVWETGGRVVLQGPWFDPEFRLLSVCSSCAVFLSDFWFLLAFICGHGATWWTGIASRLYYHRMSIVPRIDSRYTLVLTRIKHLLKLIEWYYRNCVGEMQKIKKLYFSSVKPIDFKTMGRFSRPPYKS